MSGQPSTLLQALSEPDLPDPCLVVEVGSPSKILLANSAWCALTGYTQDEVAGRSTLLLNGPLTCRDTVTALQRAMAAGQPLRVVLIHYARSSQPFLCSITATPLVNAAGQPAFYRWAVAPQFDGNAAAAAAARCAASGSAAGARRCRRPARRRWHRCGYSTADRGSAPPHYPSIIRTLRRRPPLPPPPPPPLRRRRRRRG